MITSAVQVQLARLFGSASAEATAQARTPREWKRTLRKVLEEIDRYTQTNVETDKLHWLMICSCFVAANEALKNEDFWPGYAEAITRLALLLLGDYPDHRKRKTGKRKAEHYHLSRLRGLHYLQNQDQKLKVLLAAQGAGFPELSVAPRTALSQFRAEFGYQVGFRGFVRWYKKNHPSDYASVF